MGVTDLPAKLGLYLVPITCKDIVRSDKASSGMFFVHIYTRNIGGCVKV